MKPLRYFVPPRKTVEQVCPVPSDFMRDWLAIRHDVLNDSTRDIVSINSRAERQRWCSFSRFERVCDWQDADFIYGCDWLEIFEAAGVRHNIPNFMSFVRGEYPGKLKVWSWNHDKDQRDLSDLNGLPDNELVLSYNSSCPGTNDVVVPAWNVETRQDWNPDAERPYRGGFIGFVSRSLTARHAIIQNFGRPGWHIRDTSDGKINHAIYLDRMAQFDFALCPRGGGLGSYRTWEAFQQGCVPVLFADKYVMPFADRIDWNEMLIRIPEADAGNFELVHERLSHVDVVKYRKWLAVAREGLALGGVQDLLAKRVKELLG